MAFKLSAAQSKEHQRLVAALRKATTFLLDTKSQAEDELSLTAAKVNDAVQAYNGIASEVQAFVEGIREDWRSEFDDKSDGWRDGDRGSEVDEMISQWENVDIEELNEVDVPTLDLDVDEDVAQAVEELIIG